MSHSTDTAAGILDGLDFATTCQSVLGLCRGEAEVAARFACGHARPMCRSHADRLRDACDRAAGTRRRVYRYCPDCPAPYPGTPIRVTRIDPLTDAAR
jgi:hypothetical protein